ncbi:MAG: hypothetical protein JSU00_14335 [Acidobacteria bacterium]|nr:hypothetical protein [Acidobacteriota bacterium]
MDPIALFQQHFYSLSPPSIISVPGRVNLIGEHIDYHNLPVLPMAIQRHIRIAFRPRKDRRIRAVSRQFGSREFEWNGPLEPSAAGDWVNYVKAAAQAVDGKWKTSVGIDAAVASDLPAAAGLSSSSALLTAFTLALLAANRIRASFEELMEVLPEGEYFVGTRGGGMDHAAVLAPDPGCALLVHFSPLSAESIPVPRDWAFLVAHSMVAAEKSGEVREKYNSRRVAGSTALKTVGFDSYGQAVSRHSFEDLKRLAAEKLDGDELKCFLHVTGESCRVGAAVEAMMQDDIEAFGALLDASHESLRYLLGVSCPELDELVEAAREAGAFGARLTGAGFGGCAVIACHSANREEVARELVDRFYSKREGFDASRHLIFAEPSAGALHV